MNAITIVLARNNQTLSTDFPIQAYIMRGDGSVLVRGIGQDVEGAIADLFTAAPAVEQAKALESYVASYAPEVV